MIDKIIRAYGYAPMPGIEPNPDDVQRFIESAQYRDEDGDGFLLGLIHPFHLNRSVLIASALMMDGRGSGRVLLDRFEAWAKEQGAVVTSVMVADLSADSYFENRGYRVVEHMHMRGI